MKTPILVASLVISLGLFGCSKQGGKAAGLVPNTAAEVAASPDFKLENTTPTGVKCYTRELTHEMVTAIPADSRDRHFLEDRKQPYLQVFVCNDKIVDLKEISAENPMLTPQQASDVFAWGMKRGMAADGMDKELESAIKKNAK